MTSDLPSPDKNRLTELWRELNGRGEDEYATQEEAIMMWLGWNAGVESVLSAILRVPCNHKQHLIKSPDTAGYCPGWRYPDPPKWWQPIYNWYWLCDRLWEDFDMYEYRGDDDQ
jgi:hypothetical protein